MSCADRIAAHYLPLGSDFSTCCPLGCCTTPLAKPRCWAGMWDVLGIPAGSSLWSLLRTRLGLVGKEGEESWVRVDYFCTMRILGVADTTSLYKMCPLGTGEGKSMGNEAPFVGERHPNRAEPEPEPIFPVSLRGPASQSPTGPVRNDLNPTQTPAGSKTATGKGRKGTLCLWQSPLPASSCFALGWGSQIQTNNSPC